MANSFASLTPSVVSAQAMVALKNKTAFLTDFSTSFSGEVSRKTSIQVPLYSGGTTLVDPTAFNTADSTSVVRTITPSHLYQPISLSWGEFNQFNSVEAQIGAAANKLVDKMQALVFANLSASNFSVGLSGVAAASITAANLGTAWGSVAGSDKVCYLTSTAYKNFLPTQTISFDPAGQPAYGFSKLAWTDSIVTAEAGVYGFVSSDRTAFAIACALPELNRPDMLDTMVIDLGNGLQALLTSFYDPTTRTEHYGLEALFGVSIGDTAALKLIKA